MSLKKPCRLVLILLLCLRCACALAAVPPVVVTLPGDFITPTGDPALPDNGAATDVGQGVDRAIDGTGEKYYNRSHYGVGYAGSGYVVTPAVGATVVTGLSITSGDDSPNRDPTSFSLLRVKRTAARRSRRSSPVNQAIPSLHRPSPEPDV